MHSNFEVGETFLSGKWSEVSQTPRVWDFPVLRAPRAWLHPLWPVLVTDQVHGLQFNTLSASTQRDAMLGCWEICAKNGAGLHFCLPECDATEPVSCFNLSKWQTAHRFFHHCFKKNTSVNDGKYSGNTNGMCEIRSWYHLEGRSSHFFHLPFFFFFPLVYFTTMLQFDILLPSKVHVFSRDTVM